MPSVMAANIGVWTNPHPLGQVTKDPPRLSSWLTGHEDSQSGHGELETFHDPSGHHLTSCRGLDTFSDRPRRPTNRQEHQKVIEVRNRIFVGGLTEAINEDDLRLLFGRYGQVVEVAIKARGGEQFRGFGFVTFSRNSEAAAALRDGSGEYHTLQGKKINVCAAFKRVDKVTPPPPTAAPPGWIGPAPTPMAQPAGPLPLLYNPYYYGPPVISNGMWYVGPVSAPAPGLPNSLYAGMPFGPMGGGGGGGAMFPPVPAGLFGGLGDAAPSSLLGHELGPLCRPGSVTSSSAKESRLGMEFKPPVPIGTRNAMTTTDPLHGSFTSQSVSAPWF